MEVLAHGNSTFNKVSCTNDPMAFAFSKDVCVVDNPKVLSPGRSDKLTNHQFTTSATESLLKGAKTTIRISKTGGAQQRSPIMAGQADLKTDYFRVAGHLNQDGRTQYAQAVAAKSEKTNTVLEAKPLNAETKM
jgi:hypothetical protein